MVARRGPNHGLTLAAAVVAAVVAVACSRACNAKTLLGSLYRPNQAWTFVDKFCFDEAGGYLLVHTIANPAVRDHLNPAKSGHRIAFYADMEFQWPNVYSSSNNCSWKNDQSALTLDFEYYDDTELRLKVTGNRPRWWYVAISNCNEGHIDVLSYNMTFVNAGGLFSQHFGKDAQNIYEAVIADTVAYCLILVLFTWSKKKAKNKNLQYQVLKVLTFTVWLQLIGFLMKLTHLIAFSYDGEGHPSLDDGFFFMNDVFATLVMMALVISIARGYTIRTNYMAGQRPLALVITVFFLLYVGLFVWSKQVRDPASVLYLYDSPPGYMLVVLRVLLLGWYTYLSVQSYRAEVIRVKKNFFVFFWLYGSMWFLCLPFTVWIGVILPSWTREAIVFNTVSHLTMLFYVILWYIFRPFRTGQHLVLLPLESRGAGAQTSGQIFPDLPLTT